MESEKGKLSFYAFTQSHKESIINLFTRFIPFIQEENIQNKLCILEENKVRIRE